MTPEERERMNQLCAGIQETQDYENFAALLREMSELISRKEQRRFGDSPKLIWHHNRPWKTVPAIVNKIVKAGVARQPEKAEISITTADYLFREVRIDNSFTSPEGEQIALTSGTHVDVTFEASQIVEDTSRQP